MEHLLLKSKCSIFHILENLTFQRRPKALVWSKGLFLLRSMEYSIKFDTVQAGWSIWVSTVSKFALHPSQQFFCHVGTFSSWIEPVLSRV